MRQNTKRLVAVFLLATAPKVLVAHGSECTELANAVERLACFDEAVTAAVASELDPAEGFAQLNALVAVQSADRIVELFFDNCIVDVLHLHSPVKNQAGSRVSYYEATIDMTQVDLEATGAGQRQAGPTNIFVSMNRGTSIRAFGDHEFTYLAKEKIIGWHINVPREFYPGEDLIAYALEMVPQHKRQRFTDSRTAFVPLIAPNFAPDRPEIQIAFLGLAAACQNE